MLPLYASRGSNIQRCSMKFYALSRRLAQIAAQPRAAFMSLDVEKQSAWLASSIYSQTGTFLANYRHHSRRRRLLTMRPEPPQGGLRQRGQLGQNASLITSVAPVGFADHLRFRIQSHSYPWQK